MAENCIISSGYSLGCWGTGGIKRVWLGNWSAEEMAKFELDGSDLLSAPEISGGTGIEVWEYEQDAEYAGLVQDIQANAENGTVYLEGDLTLKFTNFNASLRTAFVKLMRAPIFAIVESNMGEYYVAGYESAYRTSEGSLGLGVALDDLNGAEITLKNKSANGIYIFDGDFEYITVNS